MKLRESSHKDWQSGDTIEHINAGSLQRIADATELMAKNYAELIAERDQARRSETYWRDEADRIARSNNALRGVITKMKKART